MTMTSWLYTLIFGVIALACIGTGVLMLGADDDNGYLSIAIGVLFAAGLITGFVQAKRAKAKKLCEWYQVHFDGEAIHREAAPPNTTPWKDHITWSDIEEAEIEWADLYASDQLLLRLKNTERIVNIPTESDGGSALIHELLARGLLDPKTSLNSTNPA